MIDLFKELCQHRRRRGRWLSKQPPKFSSSKGVGSNFLFFVWVRYAKRVPDALVGFLLWPLFPPLRRSIPLRILLVENEVKQGHERLCWGIIFAWHTCVRVAQKHVRHSQKRCKRGDPYMHKGASNPQLMNRMHCVSACFSFNFDCNDYGRARSALHCVQICVLRVMQISIPVFNFALGSTNGSTGAEQERTYWSACE